MFFDYLKRRPRNPLAWMLFFAVTAAVSIAGVEARRGDWEGALLLGCVGAVIGGAVGLTAGLTVVILSWLIGLVSGGFLGRPVRRPDYWGRPLACGSCGWHTTPEGPWLVRDCLLQPSSCPACGEALHVPRVACPRCDAPRQFRLPGCWRQWWWHGVKCGACGCEYDKWGRDISRRGEKP